MACTNCEPCSGRSVKDGAVTPVALFCDLTSASGCKSPAVNWQIVCDATGARFYAVNLVCDGVLPGTLTYYDLDLAPATPTLPVDVCSGGKLDVEIQVLCDDTLNDGTTIVQFIRVIIFNNTTGVLVSVTDKNITGTAPYNLVGSIINCKSNSKTGVQTACVYNGTTFTGTYVTVDNSTVPPTLYNLGTNTIYTLGVGEVLKDCALQNVPNSISVEVVCADGGTPAFRREVLDNNDNSTVTFIGGNGVPFVPASWIPGECLENFTDSLDDMLVCADGVPAIRHETLNELGVSTVTFIGADGVALTPVTWTPGSCSDCLQFTETIICAAGIQLIKRTDCQGNSTFIGSNGTVVPTPVTYTIGECVATVAVTPVSESVEIVCADGNQAFRKEVLFSDGSSTVTFLGTDGVVIVPTTWEPGNCSDCDTFTESLVCSGGITLLKRTNSCTGIETFISSNGTIVPTPLVYTNGSCTATQLTTDSLSVSEVCADGAKAFRRETLDENGVSVVTFLSVDGTVIIPTTWTPGDCNDSANYTESFVCAAGVTLIKRTNSLTNIDVFLSSNGVIVPTPLVYTNGTCSSAQLTTDSLSVSEICADGLPAFRRETLDENGISTVTFLSTNGTVITPTTWVPGDCNVSTSYTESFVCVAGVTLIKRTNSLTNVDIFLSSNGTVVPAPLTYTNGTCVTNPVSFTESFVCAAGITLIKRTDSTGTTIFLSSNGTVVPTPLIYTNGACNTGDDSFFLEILCDTVGTFIRKYVRNSAGVITSTNVQLDGTTAYIPVGTVGNCSTDQVQIVDLCDDNGAGTIVKFKRIVKVVNGVLTILGDYIPALTAAYTTVGTVGACNCCAGASPSTIQSHMFDAIPGTPWTPAAIPATTTLIGLSFAVISGTATVVDANGTTLALIPAGYNAEWSTSYDNGVLTPHQSITSVGGRTIITMTVR